MGSTPEQIEQYLTMMDVPAFYQDEQPAHTQCIQEPFWIDVYEVTNGFYGSYGIWNENDLPRESVTWFEANAYCNNRSTHLPSEVEWEFAARGPDNLIYPWGNTFDGNLLNYCDANCNNPGSDPTHNDGYATAAPVGSYPGGASWVGALDMAGNVWEWISTSLQPYPYHPDDGREMSPEESDPTITMMLRGGGRLDPDYVVRSAQRNERKAHFYDSRFGLRCARLFDPESDGQIAAEEPPEMIMEPPSSADLGDTWTRPFDGAIMVFVPGGSFQMGSTTDQAESPGLNEHPEHPVHVDSFWIDKYQIDNKQFAEFLYLQGNQLEDGNTWYDSESDYNLLNKLSDFFKPYLGFEHHPAINVSWYGAQAYCDSIGGRLLTEAEWEYAASGPENRVYPWGNEYDCTRGNFNDWVDEESDTDQGGCDGFEYTSPAGAFPEGASWVGVLDLAGNVRDWVADWGISPYTAGLQTNPTGPESGTMKIVRGGSWDSFSWGVRTTMREEYYPSERSPTIGFRCAYPAEP
jgi:formylglycine-generating enzyme required for sulfatase activity